MSIPDLMPFFRLKAVQPARVSEISETTAAAPVPKEERVNFHIGNPLQDTRLFSTFLRLVLGIEASRADLHEGNVHAILDYLGRKEVDRPNLDFIIRSIRNSSPYLPRGGYSRKAPHALVQALCTWLERQQEPLHYDNGEQSGRREIILTSGGIDETLRILFFALSQYLEHTPTRVLSYRCEIPPVVKEFPNLLFEDLDVEERLAWEEIRELTLQQPNIPTFLVIGDLLGEEMRRKLRLWSLEHPLFFIEANDAPNHLSLAREAGLVQRVIRLLTPAIFSPRYRNLAIVFVIGNVDFLNVIENVHFNLKGTPSASEVEFLIFLLEHDPVGISDKVFSSLPTPSPSLEGLLLRPETEMTLARMATRAEHSLQNRLEHHTRQLRSVLIGLEDKTTAFTHVLQRFYRNEPDNEFYSLNALDLLEMFIRNVDNLDWCQALERSFLSVFLKHQPQYRSDACLIVSGSARTALGILGLHCGLGEVLVPDLSWSYEQCFPTVHAVPLTESLELDAEAMIAAIEDRCRRDPFWKRRGAVMVNNPHNATGQVFDEQVMRHLLIYCLQHDLYVVDDLAYQNVVPTDDLPEIKTLRQIAAELVRLGIVKEEQADRVITVHSISKTDCMAGARLAVVEIRERSLRERFQAVNARIRPNLAAIFLGYLFYRNSGQAVRTYWQLRNRIFQERTQALLTTSNNLPSDRNPFDLIIWPPKGGMYPRLQIRRLPPGLSLDWLASSLARQGIGLLPMSTFARTEQGFETARTTFRLTLGGEDNAEILLAKARRLLIDLNRLISEEEAQYNRKQFSVHLPEHPRSNLRELDQAWESVAGQIALTCERGGWLIPPEAMLGSEQSLQKDFLKRYLPERLEVFRTRLLDRALIQDELLRRGRQDNAQWLSERLEREFIEDSLARRQELFRSRSYDRTVHPTQMYSLQAELVLDAIVSALMGQQSISPVSIEKVARELWKEYLGQNVAINSPLEAEEILLDLDALIAAEEYAALFTNTKLSLFLSFWSDWDGSNRPSGQGHRLLASVVMENTQRMAGILRLLRQSDPEVPVSTELLAELESLPQRNRHFTRLLNAITSLTHQLEQRYRGVLPYSLEETPWQRMAVRFHLRRDPVRVLWEHNDRYERKMLELRRQRRAMLEYYFFLNKRLREQLHALIPHIYRQRAVTPLLWEAVRYRDLLQRTVITPRIHQGMLTARDPFATDTTLYNVNEINFISGRYGNPGMVLALQISLSSKAEVLIALDRKMRVRREERLREDPSVNLPSVWLIPLFEDADSVRALPQYLDQIWDYALQSRHTSQSPQQRFAEIVPEVFIAGSDLSQQVSQAAAAFLYRQAKFDLHVWLAEHGLTEMVRIKLGSGEPMQRQGGYYSYVAGQAAFCNNDENQRRFARFLPASARASIRFAVTPLQGVILCPDLRTFQSNLSERVRFLPVRDFTHLLCHIRESQRQHRDDLIRAAEILTESRLETRNRGLQELKRLTIGIGEKPYLEFLEELTDSFRHILYGREEDVVGIHIISYFIGRSLPQLRDRPTSRRGPMSGINRGQQMLASIADIVPLSKHGSLLRAIVHNQAQTVVLGVNQLTTGLFRALERFSQKAFVQAERERMLGEHILPHLPVYEILQSLRLYEDHQGEFLRRIENALPAGNSALVALREDRDAMPRYVPLFQRELLRRHGISVEHFFTERAFIPDLLPTLRPDLAVLLQPDLFNTRLDSLLERISERIPEEWQEEVARLLQLPEQIRQWRLIIWEVLGESLYQSVHGFTELAVALYAFSSTRVSSPSYSSPRSVKLSPSLNSFFRGAWMDDEMRHFLMSAIEYLSSFAEGSIEVPVSIIRAINDVERIAQIEESALPPAKQEVLRCCLLQIARLAGENS